MAAQQSVTGPRWMAVGRSTLPDSRHAALEAATAALSDGDSPRLDPKLVMVFSSGRHDLLTVLRTIQESAGGAPVVGCSTAGEIAHGGVTHDRVTGDGITDDGVTDDGVTDDGVVVTALGGSGFRISTALARQAGARPRAAGAEIARCLDDVAHSRHCALMLLVDGAAQEQEEIVRGVYGVVGASVPLVGGCAAETTSERPTTEFYGTEVLADAAIAVAIGSDAPLGIGMSHGWRISGEPMVVTSAHKGRIFTLDDRPALDVYLDRLKAPAGAYKNADEFAPYASARPLGIRRRSGDAVRGLAGSPDFASRTLRCSGEIAQGSLIWLMEGNADTMLDATDEACRQALDAVGTQPLGLIAFDCSGRRDVLGEEGVREEAKRLAAFAGEAPLAGFYSHGEIARTRGINGFHHQTLVILAVA